MSYLADNPRFYTISERADIRITEDIFTYGVYLRAELSARYYFAAGVEE